jgi:aminopeptidase N
VAGRGDRRQIFDEISYGKGGSILRMIEAYVGEDAFRNGVSTYLNRFKFSNANGEDLWIALEEASGKQVAMIMREWIKKPGYPLLVAEVKGEKAKRENHLHNVQNLQNARDLQEVRRHMGRSCYPSHNHRDHACQRRDKS